MNKERILKLAETIEKSKTYDQSKFLNDDGSSANLAAHAIDLFREEHEKSFEDKLKDIFSRVTKHSGYPARRFVGDWNGFKNYYGNTFSESLYYLGLTQSQGVFLYALNPMDTPPTTEDAVRTLRCLAETNEVVWLFS